MKSEILVNKTPMRFLIFGAGAIGTYIGGSLALAGQPVVFLERGSLVQGLRERGLRLKLLDGEKQVPNPIVVSSLSDALKVGPFDMAVFAVKSFDTETTLYGLGDLARKLPPILCLQNGVENEPAITKILGSERVIPGTVTSAIGRRNAGDIVLERLRGLGVAAGHPLSEKLVDVLQNAGLKPRLYASAADMKWSKMLTNLIANASSAILDMTPGEIFADPRLYGMEIQQLRETLNVMKALGIGVVDLPGTPVRALAAAVRYTPQAISRPFLQRAVGHGRGGKMPSFHIDLHQHRGKSEVEYLNGAVVRFGEKVGVATPVNRFLTKTLMGLTLGSIPEETFEHQPVKLLQCFEQEIRHSV